jgi:D-alanyl-lipoteichoic acid acyltransferase DltB (MBOAT superfamily)
MNFASWPFIGLFLPLTLILFHAVRGNNSAHIRQVLLIIASFVFYAWAGWLDLSVFLASIVVNYGAGHLLTTRDQWTRTQRKTLMWAAVAANIAFLLGFKVRLLGVTDTTGFNATEQIYIPLAISFYTFQQLGFVAGCYRRQIKQVSPTNYLFFIAFFPHLVLGPILRFQDIDQQIRKNALAHVTGADLCTGLAIFIFGLSKKLLVADRLAPTIDQLFNVTSYSAMSAADMWFAIIAFQLQLFLDFSAYADMAIGLGKMVGIRMPINFDRPHFATDRFDLWRRWHISFVIFMRTNVFLPIVRHWKWPVPAALAATGILSGLWHGLGWTFVAWGLLQTAIMLGTHYRNTRWRRQGTAARHVRVQRIAATFTITCLVGALFRSPDLVAITHIGQSLGSFATPPGIIATLPLSVWLTAALAVALVWVLPDTPQLFRKHWTAIDMRPDGKPQPIHWMERWLPPLFSARWAIALAVLFVLCLLRLSAAQRFVYVQF